MIANKKIKLDLIFRKQHYPWNEINMFSEILNQKKKEKNKFANFIESTVKGWIAFQPNISYFSLLKFFFVLHSNSWNYCCADRSKYSMLPLTFQILTYQLLRYLSIQIGGGGVIPFLTNISRIVFKTSQ